MEIMFWVLAVLSLAANVLALLLLVQLLRRVDREVIHGWSRRLGFLVIGLAGAWSIATIVNAATAARDPVVAQIGREATAHGIDPSQKATLLAIMISELMNCLAAMALLLLLPAIIAIVVWVRSAPKRRPS